jgi:putative ABC transport system permease protein
MKRFRLLYRLALGVLPRHFRARHGAQALRMASRRVREESGGRRVSRAARELVDLLWAAPRIRRESAWAGVRPYPTASGGAMRDGLVSDIRHAWRSLLRTRGFLLVAITTLSAGIALCVSVMALVNAYLVRGLPYPESERLYWVRYGQPGGPFVQNLEKLDWRALDDVIEQPIAWDLDLFNLRGAPYPEAAQGTWVTSGYMEGFGVRPAQGRAFLPADFAAGAPPVALISHRLWQTRFGGAPDIVGRSFEAYVSDRPDEPQTFTVAGVLPEGLWHLNVFTEIMAPLRAPTYPYMARVRRGVTPEVLAGRITSLVRAGGASVPEGWRVDLQSAHDSYVQQVRPLLIALATATGLVMLIACANVAVLFTVRATHRQREIAVRKALGASAARIARALAAEAVVLGTVATAIGLALAQAIITATAPLLERHLGRSAPGGASALAIDGAILAGALLTGLFVIVVCCAAQFWTSARAPLAQALTAGQKGASAGPQQRRAHAVLIALEVAACLTLLVGAALMIQSGLRILAVDMGLQTRDVVVGRLSLSQRKYPDAERRNAFYDRVVAGVHAIAGPRGVAFANAWPLQQAPSRDVGRDEPQVPLSARAGVVAVSPAYFETLGIGLDEGRAFTSGDTPGTERVAIVSRTLAARLWPGRRAVGERLRMAPAPNAAPPAQPTSFLVVGVVADVRHVHTDNDLADAYLAIRQFPSPAPFMYVRASGIMPRIERDLRAVLASLDPEMALGTTRPLSDILDQQRAGSRFLASLLGVFSFLAAVLALLGIYGVIAYTVRQREREIAIRLAVGADRGTITRLFLRQGAAVLAVGLAMGVGGALLLGRLLQAQLFGVRPADPMAIAAVAVPFALCGLAAIAWPARTAAATDPAAALKN